MTNLFKIKLAFQQSQLDYLDAIETLQKECGMTGKEAEALVELWDEGSMVTSQKLGGEA